MKVFLGDLVHDWEKVSLWTMPLNVGYIGAYARKALPGELDVRLFKRPELMIDAIKAKKPEVVGLTHYVWNANLNALVFAIAKEHNPRVLAVCGGPNFTSANADEKHGRRFFEAVPDCDAYVINQGERGFAELLLQFVACGGDVERLTAEAVPGSLLNDLARAGRVRIGEALDVIRDLDEIPSPYLNGLMDPFFEEPFVPILETNRSCPYRCTFCAWGIGTGKLATFSDARVFAEIDYIGGHCTQSMNLFIADANFSILDRDAAIAKRLRDSHLERGYPGHVSAQWNKTRPDRVLRVARELGAISEVGASMQSLKPEVLAAIKRRNLPVDVVADMVAKLNEEGIEMPLFTELILGLPEETHESHIEANKIMIDLGAEVFNYNLHLLPGTEMDTQESRARYFHRTGWRLHDNAFGIYDGVKVFEGQEVVLETSTMSMEELRGFRFIHFLIQFMWGRKWYYDFLHLFRQAGIHPVDMVVRIARAFADDEGEMGMLYARFCEDHTLENFESFADLAAHWSIEENTERLKRGDYGKLNYVYSYAILLEHHDAFNVFLERVSRETVDELGLDDAATFVEQCTDVLLFSREIQVTLTRSLDMVESKRRSFAFDLLAWSENGYLGAPARISTSDRYEYEFYLPDRQKTVLERQLSQFRSDNVGLTLRKMSEEIGADQFFYQVREASAAAHID